MKDILDNDEKRVIHSKSDNTEANEVLKELFNSLKNEYQNNLELMKDCGFVFDYAYLLYYKCHPKNQNRDGPYIDSPHWIKIKKQQ